jgi:arylsulfatase A-like enzyme
MKTIKYTRVLVTIIISFQVCFAQNLREPNIIVVYVDDLGWTDTSVQMIQGDDNTRSDFYETPNLERLAANGLVFSQAYSASPVCTPSRTSFQFGKSPARLQNTTVYDILAITRNKRCQGEISVHERIKKNDPDYITAHFGKWGCDVRREPGYDVDDGNTNNIDGDWKVRNEVRHPDDDPKAIFSLTERTNKFITERVQNKEPFYIQLSHYAPHVQNYARPETVEKYKNKRGKKSSSYDYDHPNPNRNGWMPNYAGMVDDLDAGLGILLDHLEKLDIADNTYIIFTSDNGGGFRGNAPLSGGKASLWEGGIRVPTVVTGPGVKLGYCSIPVASWDWYATINEITGGKQLEKDYDGGSLLDIFKKGDKGKVKRGTQEIIFHYPWYGGTMPASAIVDGNYKVLVNLQTYESRLFDVVADPGENNDLSFDMVEKKSKLLNRLNDYLKEVDAEKIEDMFQVRLDELAKRIEFHREKGNNQMMINEQRQFDHISKARENKSWRK